MCLTFIWKRLTQTQLNREIDHGNHQSQINMIKIIRCQQQKWFCRKARVPFIQGHCKHVWQCHVVLYTRSSSAYKTSTFQSSFRLCPITRRISFRCTTGCVNDTGTHIPIRILWIIWKIAENKKGKWRNQFIITQTGIAISTFNQKNFNITWSTDNKYKECQKPWPHRIFLLLRSLKQWKGEMFHK